MNALVGGSRVVVDGDLICSARMRHHAARRGRAWLFVPVAIALIGFCLSACGDPVAQQVIRSTTVTDPIDLQKLDCPAGSVKVIIELIKETMLGQGDSNNSAATAQGLQITCIGQRTGQDVVLKTTYTGVSDPNYEPPGVFMVGPDNPHGVDQIEAGLGPGGFTPVDGVGDRAASVVETVDSERTVTLYVQRGDVAFHVSMQRQQPDALVRDQERRLATLILAHLPAGSDTSSSPTPAGGLAAFMNGDYAAGLLTANEVATALGRPALPLSANGGRLAYAPGIDVSNAITYATDGSASLTLRILRASTADAARTFLSTMIEFPKETPDPDLAGLGDAAHRDSSGLYVLGGREIANITVERLSPSDTLRTEKAVAALLAPKLLH